MLADPIVCSAPCSIPCSIYLCYFAVSLLCLLASFFFFAQQPLTDSVNYFEHPLRLLEASIYGFLQGGVVTLQPANLQAALQGRQRLTEIMKLFMHLLYGRIANGAARL
jgi:hypothetical protein